MSNPIYTTWPSETLASDALAEMALDLLWSWNHYADELWERLDPELWDHTHNPWVVLQTISREKLQRVTQDADFQRLLAEISEEKRLLVESDAWFQKTYPQPPFHAVAYFSMEFMLSEALPIYSGGLGNVAGDQLKTASNLGVPIIAVGLLYQQGYFRQVINAQGRQEALYPFNDPGRLPVRPVREANGEWLRFPLAFPGSRLWVRAWQVQVGRTRLYLLDTNDPVNLPAHRGIGGELYGGGPELRLQQELVLGIGGWRLLAALGLDPEVCHLNEGHAAFAVLERARSYMAANRKPFDLALTITRAGNLFTTHTPVEAGFDRFVPSLMQKYFGRYAEEDLLISFDDLMALGRRDRHDGTEPFNMAYLATRGSAAVNGVSRLHGEVSRRIFQTLFPRWPQAEVPVSHVTNGVNMPTWNSVEAQQLWEKVCGKQPWHGATEHLAQDIRRVSDSALWQLRAKGRQSLVQYVRGRLIQQLAGQGSPAAEVVRAAQLLDPDALTLGFARRFATYKRPNLLLHDPERLIRMLTNRQRPVQLVLAGKAHPQDLEGQAMIEQWIDFVRRPEVWSRAVFVTDYDMLVAEHLVQGIDVWINTPRRPWEASGTSGMKVLVNGGLNVSELDGWWAEAYAPEVGWALGDGKEHGDDPSIDRAEAEELYRLLEEQVIPEFFARDERGIPPAWIGRMKESMARLTPVFSANRAVRQYTEEFYLPAAAAYRSRAANGGELGKELLDWQHQLATHWDRLRMGSVTTARQEGQYVFSVQVYLDQLDPRAVRVELYADGLNGGEPVRQPMTQAESLPGPGNGYVYVARVPSERPATDYTPRLIAWKNGALIPLEAPWIRWFDSPA